MLEIKKIQSYLLKNNPSPLVSKLFGNPELYKSVILSKTLNILHEQLGLVKNNKLKSDILVQEARGILFVNFFRDTKLEEFLLHPSVIHYYLEHPHKLRKDFKTIEPSLLKKYASSFVDSNILKFAEKNYELINIQNENSLTPFFKEYDKTIFPVKDRIKFFQCMVDISNKSYKKHGFCYEDFLLQLETLYSHHHFYNPRIGPEKILKVIDLINFPISENILYSLGNKNTEFFSILEKKNLNLAVKNPNRNKLKTL